VRASVSFLALLGGLGVASCGGGQSPRSAAALLPPPPDLSGSYVSPASFRYHPEQQARVEAREQLADGRTLLVGRRGERWLYDPRSKRLEAGASLAPEDLVAILRGPDQSFWFVGRSGTSYEAREPLGAFVRSSAPFDRLAEVTAARGALLAVRVDRKLVRSADGGASWQDTGPEDQRFVDVEMAGNGHALALAAPERLWVSRDAGVTFSALDLPQQGVLALERDPVKGTVRVLTPLAAYAYDPGSNPPLVPADATQPKITELGTPPSGPNAGALAEGRAVIAGGEYLEAESSEDGKRSWSLLRGRLGEVLKSAPLPDAKGCRNVRLAATGRFITLACFRTSAESASQPIEVFRSESGGRRFEKEPFTPHGSLAALRMALGPEGQLIMTGICPTAVSGPGCAVSGVHHRRPTKESSKKKKREPNEPPRPLLELGASATPSLVDSALALAFASGGRVAYALGRSGKTGQLALFLSKDGGKSFEPEELDLSGARDSDYGDSSDGTRVDALVPAEDGSVGIVLSRYRTRTLVVADELGRVLSVARPPEEPALLGVAGTRVLAVSPSLGLIWESLDGGATWERAGKLPIVLCPDDEQCDVPLQCAPEGCVIGHELSRIGWGGQAEEELGLMSPADAVPSEALERRVRTPLECTLGTSPFKILAGARELPTAHRAALGKVAWFAPASDPDKASAFVHHGFGGSKPRVETVSLLGASPRPQTQAFMVTSQIEGAAALRYTIPSGNERRLLNVEVAWSNLFENRVVQARLRDAGVITSGDWTHEGSGLQTAHPDLISVAEGGLYLRVHASPKDRQSTYYFDGHGVSELPPIPWPANALRQGRSEMARVGNDHLGLLLYGGGAAVVRARRSGDTWRFDAGVTGLAAPQAFGLLQDFGITYADGRAVFHVELDDTAGHGGSAQIYPLRAEGAVIDAPQPVPTQADGPVQPQPCGSAERQSSVRVIAPFLQGTRHPVIVSDAVDAPRVMLTAEAVLYGTPGSPCVAAFGVEAIPNESGMTPAETAIIAPDDLEHAWFFRQVPTPNAAGLRIEYRAMSCRFAPTLEIPPELYRVPGTLAPRRR
jgi:hypothetical protein